MLGKKTTRYRCNECGVASFKNGEHKSKSASTLDCDNPITVKVKPKHRVSVFKQLSQRKFLEGLVTAQI